MAATWGTAGTRAFLACLAGGLLVALGASVANAAVSCSFAGSTMTVTLTAANEAAVIDHANNGNIRVNGKKVDRPGYLTESGDAVAVAPGKTRERAQLMENVERGPQLRLPSYIAMDPSDKFAGRVIGSPMKGDVPFPVNGSALVEFYAR